MYRSRPERAPEGRLVTIRRYLDPLAAHLARAELANEEIAAYVVDPPRYKPTMSGAMAEAQLQVDEQDVERATAVLENAERAAREAQVDDGEGSGVVRCPRCELAYCFHERTPLGKGGTPTIVHLIAGLVGLVRGKRWHCHRCGHVWDDPKEGPAAMTRLEPGDPKPVFRLERAHAGMGLFLGGFSGLLGGALVGQVGVLLFVAAPVAGWLLGRSFRQDFCSEPNCRAPLPRGVEECPQCHGTVAGRVRTAQEHYVAAAEVRRELAELRAADEAITKQPKKKRRAASDQSGD